MTPDEITIALALGRCTYQPGTAPKRFAADMESFARMAISQNGIVGPLPPQLSRRQSLALLIQGYAFRRQLPKDVNRIVLRNLMPALDECIQQGFHLNRDLDLLRLKVYQLKKAGGDLG